MVAIAVMVLRKTDPDRKRPFRTPLVWIVAPVAILGCAFLFFSLGRDTKMMFLIWAAIGLVVYFAYGFRNSHLGRGIIDVPELAADAPPDSVPPMPGAQ